MRRNRLPRWPTKRHLPRLTRLLLPLTRLHLRPTQLRRRLLIRLPRGPLIRVHRRALLTLLLPVALILVAPRRPTPAVLRAGGLVGRLRLMVARLEVP